MFIHKPRLYINFKTSLILVLQPLLARNVLDVTQIYHMQITCPHGWVMYGINVVVTIIDYEHLYMKCTDDFICWIRECGTKHDATNWAIAGISTCDVTIVVPVANVCLAWNGDTGRGNCNQRNAFNRATVHAETFECHLYISCFYLV